MTNQGNKCTVYKVSLVVPLNNSQNMKNNCDWIMVLPERKRDMYIYFCDNTHPYPPALTTIMQSLLSCSHNAHTLTTLM